MTMFCSSLKATWAMALGLLAAAAAPQAAAQPAPLPFKVTPRVQQASADLIRAQNRFVKEVLLSVDACGKQVACSVGVRPNLVGGRPGVVAMQVKTAAMSCEAVCNEVEDGEKRQQCLDWCSKMISKLR